MLITFSDLQSRLFCNPIHSWDVSLHVLCHCFRRCCREISTIRIGFIAWAPYSTDFRQHTTKYLFHLDKICQISATKTTHHVFTAFCRAVCRFCQSFSAIHVQWIFIEHGWTRGCSPIHNYSVEQSFRLTEERVNVSTCSSAVLAKQRHLRGITAECLDIVVNPLKGQVLIFQAKVSRAFCVIGTHETKRTQTIIKRHEYNVLVEQILRT